MNKLLSLITSCSLGLLLAGSCFAAEDYVANAVYDGYQIIYSPTAGQFSDGGMADDRIILKKSTSVGTGSYSSYSYNNGKEVLDLSSNFEFITHGRLIACDNANLKYYEVIHKNGIFAAKLLTPEEVQGVFPDAKLIKISDFKDDKITVDDSKKTLIIYNDTDANFYKYSFDPASVKVSNDIVGLINIDGVKNISFSHYGDNNQIYKKYEINIQ